MFLIEFECIVGIVFKFSQSPTDLNGLACPVTQYDTYSYTIPPIIYLICEVCTARRHESIN